jgi:uncharacterized YccA/Bax inhibitor family protein
MARLPARRFTLADMMIVVAAVAVGMLISRFANANASPWYPKTIRWTIKLQSSPFATMVPVALLILRSIPPRPSARQIFRQPGSVACAVAVFIMVQGDLMLLSQSTLKPYLGGSRTGYLAEEYVTYIYHTGFEVALVWVYLACARLWKPEPSWIDRSGRIFGAMMIAIYSIEFLGY